MLRTRIIPTLLLHGKSLVKTKRFAKYEYIGDPANTVRIFNELEADELCFLDIKAARNRTAPDFETLTDIANEGFMPTSYGGGIDSLDIAKRIFDTGFEKIIINTAAYENPDLITSIANVYGSQAVVVSMDVKRDLWKRKFLVACGGKRREDANPIEWARQVERMGAGELLITAIDQEGTWMGFDVPMVRSVAEVVNIPVIAHGGGGSYSDIQEVIDDGGASAVALGSFVVFQRRGMGVLVNFPDELRHLRTFKKY